MARPSPKLVIAALVLVQVLFGLNYVVSKVVVQAFPPLVWATIRIVISAAILFAAAILMRRPHPKGGILFFGPLVVYALLATVVNQAAFLVGLRYTTSTNAAILNTLIPVFTLLFVSLKGDEPFTMRRGFGFAAALGGVLVLRKVEDFTLSDSTVFGDLLQILNCMSYALFLAYGKKFVEQHDRVWMTAWMFFYGSFGIGALSLNQWWEFTPPVMTPMLLGCATFAVLGATLLTYFLNNWALAYSKSSNVALFIYIQPVIAALLAWGWMGTPITMRTVLSTGLIFVGVYLSIQGAKPSLQKEALTRMSTSKGL